MWTPKRIVLLAGSFMAFMLVYLLYTLTALGRINTLPPLPDQYKPSEGEDSAKIVRPPRLRQPTVLEQKLEMAFHPGCEELKWPVRLELNAKSMVIAAWKFEIADRGRVKMELMSLALFGKKKNDGREIEINTLKCKQAYITFDRPIRDITPSEMNGRKVVEAELFGDSTRPIYITNNRRTAVRSDDLVVRVNTGPLNYIEKSQLVKTSDYVHLIDGDSTFQDGRLIQPKAVIDAKGMEMELLTAAPPVSRPGVSSHKQKSESITGVKRIVLKEDVDMTLRVAGGGPFPNNEKASAASQPQEKRGGRLSDPSRSPAEPAVVHIQTPGRFEYEILKDHDMARFDVPKNPDHPNSPQDVTVTRLNEQNGKEMFDMLVCKHLELRIKRRNSDTPAAREGTPGEQGMEIETAHATGPDVTLTSDAEKLDAHGIDFVHDATKKLTILKGSPYMEANKEDSLIQAPELRIQDVPLTESGAGASPASSSTAVAGSKGGQRPPKTYQKIEASGPGSIHMHNKTTGKQNIHASWKENLLSTRDGPMDLLILTGSARFVDDEHGQTLQAETLRVWLLGEDKKSPVAVAKNGAPPAKLQTTTSSAMPGSSRRPHRVEALRNVLARSSELNIHDAARLVIHFLDVPPERMPPPASAKTESRLSLGGGNNPSSTSAVPQTPGGGDKSRSVAVAAPAASQPQPSGSGGTNRATAAAPASSPAGTSGSSGENRTPIAAAATLSAPQMPAGGGEKRTLTVTPPTTPSPRPSGNSGNNRAPAAPAQRPIDLSARSIEAKVLRCAERMTLDHLWAEGGSLDAVDNRGGVVVRQEPAKPGEEGVYIEGNTLDMNSFPNGNVLVVTGDLAQLRMDKIFILGPEVHIDQVANRAWVEGAGAMRMHNTTTLEGKPLAHPVPLTVHWSNNMLFYGTFAEFFGSIHAEQDNALLACQHLQVLFDRPISLKEGMRGSQPAKVKKLVGDKGADDKPVRVEDQTYAAGQLQKYQMLMGSVIQMDTVPRDEDDLQETDPSGARKNSDANKVTLSGPGSLRILQRGGTEMVSTPGAPAPRQINDRPDAAAATDQQMKMTYIRFENRMMASNLTNMASFWGAVRVLNQPCEDPHCDIDLDAILSNDLPEGAMYLRCNHLHVRTYQKPLPGASGAKRKQLRTYQEMDALGQVYVQGKDFTAQCDHMKFNEEKDQVIFIGEGDNEAVMSKGDIKGGRPQMMRAKKLIYIRSTGAVYADKIGSIDG